MPWRHLIQKPKIAKATTDQETTRTREPRGWIWISSACLSKHATPSETKVVPAFPYVEGTAVRSSRAPSCSGAENSLPGSGIHKLQILAVLTARVRAVLEELMARNKRRRWSNSTWITPSSSTPTSWTTRCLSAQPLGAEPRGGRRLELKRSNYRMACGPAIHALEPSRCFDCAVKFLYGIHDELCLLQLFACLCLYLFFLILCL